MTRDFGEILRDLEGAPLRSAPDRNLTLGEACANALLAQYEDDARTSGEEKLKRYKLAGRVYKKQFSEVSTEEIALMKTLLAKAYGPTVVGPAYEALESDPIQNVAASFDKPSKRA